MKPSVRISSTNRFAVRREGGPFMEAVEVKSSAAKWSTKSDPDAPPCASCSRTLGKGITEWGCRVSIGGNSDHNLSAYVWRAAASG
jgi:hypothetical protein